MNTLSSPLVSVVLPAYNAAETLTTAVDSIIFQTYWNIELIIIDDGSTDHTLEIIRQYVAMDARVKGFTIEHAGIAKALNSGIVQAQGEYIARMDADDDCMPTRIEEQVRFMEAHPDVGLLGTQVEFGGNRDAAGGYARHVDWTNTLLTHEQIMLHRFQESPFAHPSVMFRKSVFDRFGGYVSGDVPEDYELWLRWMELGVKTAKIPKELLIWNDPPNRLSRISEACSVDSFYKTKTPYLATWLHDTVAPKKKFYVIGAGKLSRQRALLLEKCGILISGWIDVDPKKIGNIVNGKKVYGRDILKKEPCFAIAYLAGHDANDQLVEFMDSEGLIMGQDYILAS